MKNYTKLSILFKYLLICVNKGDLPPFQETQQSVVKLQSLIRNDLTLNAVEKNFEAWAQLLVLHPFKLLGKSVDCTLEGVMPLDLCFNCSRIDWFAAAAGHP